MFHDEEKKIFRYHVSDKERFADPLAVWRALVRESRGEFDRWRTDASANDPPAVAVPEGELTAEQAQKFAVASAFRASMVMSRLDAEERILDCIRAAFGLAKFDPETGSGVPEYVCWLVLAAFEGWLEKNGSGAGN